jgi:DNA polymerase-4
MPSVTAQRKCPELIFVKPRFEVYKAVSQQVRAIFADYTPLIEPLSLDEAYLDVTDNLKGMPSATAVAEDIRARIKAETGLTASAGVSYNKFLAKLASGRNKPDGLFVITPQMGPGFVATLPVAKFHGVGPATAARMHRLGIETGRDLAAQTLEFLRQHFGKAGRFYFDIARGIDHRCVKPDRVRKSVGAENTFGEDLTEFEALTAALTPLIEKVWRHCESHQLSARTVTLKVKYRDFTIITRRVTFRLPMSGAEELAHAAKQLLADVTPPRLPIRLLGVTLSNLEPVTEEERRPAQLALSLREQAAPKHPQVQSSQLAVIRR